MKNAREKYENSVESWWSELQSYNQTVETGIWSNDGQTKEEEKNEGKRKKGREEALTIVDLKPRAQEGAEREVEEDKGKGQSPFI